ncbi:Dolichyl-phosphate-mannose-protein mannosyltransferase [Bryocella elongata]|uniref:Dolichyl-phosphate-mannose-protein mannosyltransferase n=1 Tax=Bryocella elongata TaxID=863522 RepID=A0A1H5THW5_9BACT|nr:Dolichyl-phosphate-mannose-protein mannosyltransferase [Bryocella elongata]
MVWALLAGLTVRAAFLHGRPEVSGDTLLYGEIAQNVLRHHLYGRTTDSLHATWIRLPGYPLFLAASFLVFGAGSYYPVLWLNVALDLATCLLIGAIAARLGGRRVGLIALWIAALCPFTANYCAVALTETPSLLCVAVAFYGLQRMTQVSVGKVCWAAVVGAALAVAVLLRPEQGLLSAAVVPAVLWVGWRSRSRRGSRGLAEAIAPAALSCAIVLLPLLGWGIRNARVMGHFEPLAPKSATDPGEQVPSGFNHWYRTWGIDFKSTYDVYWNYDGAGMALTDLPRRAIDNAEQRAQTEKVFAEYNVMQLARPQFDIQFERIAEERDHLHPLRSHLVLPIARVVNMWLRPRTELMDLPLDWWNWKAHAKGFSIAAALALLNLGFLMVAGAGVWRQRCCLDVVQMSMLGFVVLRSALLLTLDNSEPRYTLECLPVLIVFAALAFRRDLRMGRTLRQVATPSG